MFKLFSKPFKPNLNVNATPLTDLETRKILQCGPVQKVSADFARKLERKLNEYQRDYGVDPLDDGKASG